MKERKESGPTRPCHSREAYRRLKLEGKVPKRSVTKALSVDGTQAHIWWLLARGF